MLAESFGKALEAILVVHVHAARVGGDAQEVGDKKQQRLRVRRAEVAIERRKLILLGAARVELAHVADKDYLEGRHERGRLRVIEHFKDGGCCEVEVGEAEIAQIGLNEGLEDGGAAAIQQEDLVAGEDIAGAK